MFVQICFRFAVGLLEWSVYQWREIYRSDAVRKVRSTTLHDTTPRGTLTRLPLSSQTPLNVDADFHNFPPSHLGLHLINTPTVIQVLDWR